MRGSDTGVVQCVREWCVYNSASAMMGNNAAGRARTTNYVLCDDLVPARHQVAQQSLNAGCRHINLWCLICAVIYGLWVLGTAVVC